MFHVPRLKQPTCHVGTRLFSMSWLLVTGGGVPLEAFTAVAVLHLEAQPKCAKTPETDAQLSAIRALDPQFVILGVPVW